MRPDEEQAVLEGVYEEIIELRADNKKKDRYIAFLHDKIDDLEHDNNSLRQQLFICDECKQRGVKDRLFPPA